MRIKVLSDTNNVIRIDSLKPGQLFRKLDNNYRIYMVTYGGSVIEYNSDIPSYGSVVVVNLETGILENIVYYSYVKQVNGFFTEEEIK